MAKKVYQGHADGYTFNSSEDATDPSGIRFFSIKNLSSEDFINKGASIDDIINSYGSVTAKNISLSSDVLDDIGNMFKSFTDPTNNNDSDAISSLLKFKDDPTMFGSYNLEDNISGIITNLGVDAEIAKNLNKSHETMMVQYEEQREAYSGVSLDEEGANLLRYQEMYSAAAKIMSVFSEMYDTLVNII